MRTLWHVSLTAVLCVLAAASAGLCADQSAVALPGGVKAVWDMSKAYHETTPTQERICINGLWRWQPATTKSDQPPSGNWGYFKVPGGWPGITDYMQKDSQTVHAHPSWKGEQLRGVSAAWHEREIAIPNDWAGRRISITTEYLNSYAAVYVDGKKVGEMRFPAGEVDLTTVCRPGGRHVLSILVAAVSARQLTPSTYDKSAE
jgi:beta-galactosidase